MAYLGFGVWSLVVNLCLFTVLQAAAYGWYAPPRFRLPLDRRIAVRLWRYSAPLTGSSILSKIYDNADYLVVGKVLGVTPLGYYTLAFRVAMLINERISAVINRVAFPSFANLKEDTPRVVEHWFAVTRRVTLITFPLLVWLAFSAEDLIRIALGTRWLPAALPLQFLCGMTAVKILTNVVGQILAAVGYPVIVLRYDIITAIALPAGFVIGCKTGGLVGMGIAWCTVFPLVRFLFLLATRAALHFSLAAYARNLFEALWVSLLCAALMTPVAWLLPSGLLRLCLGSLNCVIAVLLAVALSSNLRRLIVETISNPFGGE
jgi:teichuronic acid exporter